MKKESTMFQIAVRWVVSFAILAGGVSAMLALGGWKQETRPPSDVELAPLIETIPVTLHNAPLDIEVDGVVTPFREIEIKAQVSGRIDKKVEACRTGRYVHQGELLIEIDLVRYERELRIILAEIKELDIDVENTLTLIQLAQSERQLQQKDLDRLLSVDEDGVYSDSEIDQARRAVLAAENAVQTLQNKLTLTRARLNRSKITEERARDDLDRATVRSPVDGVIVSDTVELASYVGTGQSLFVVEDTSAVEVKCNLETDEIYWLWCQSSQNRGEAASDERGAYELPPAPAIISYQLAGRADLKFSWNGRLSRYDGIGVDEKTRTVPCRLVIDRPRKAEVSRKGVVITDGNAVSPPALVRGMYVKVVIRSEPSAEFVKLPESAVRPDKKVWRVKDGKLELLGPLPLVKLVEEEGPAGPTRYWLVPKAESGMQDGDPLVTIPPTGAQPGMTVRVATEVPPKTTGERDASSSQKEPSA
ncbi:MAG: efflux RND transporter periplasmic adaptor subunit [Pirellulaceae bacterium]